MKMPEPVSYWIPDAEQFCIPTNSERPFAKAWQPLYDKQALIDLLEEAAQVCESRQTPNTGSVAILNGAADAIRSMKEKL